MKGFFLTLCAILLFISLFFFSLFYLKKQRETEVSIIELQPIETAGYVFDDIGTDLNKMIGLQIGVLRNASALSITFKDHLPEKIDKNILYAYKEFIEKEYANQLHANISMNISNLIAGPEVIFSNGLAYNSSNTEGIVYSLNGDTHATNFNISIFANAYRENISSWKWNLSGDVYVNIYYSDLNGTIIEEGKISSDILNIYEINYTPSATLYIMVGKIWDKKRAAMIQQSNVSVNYTLQIVLPPPETNTSLIYFYNVKINYTQGNVFKETFVEIERR